MSEQIVLQSDEFSGKYCWITEDFVRNIINKIHPDKSIAEIKFTLKSALGKGENYASQMILLDVKYILNNDSLSNQQNISFIVKTEIKELEFLSEEYNVFANEIKIFEEVLPKVDELLLTVQLQEQIGARIFGTGLKPSYLVFENLKSRGYRNLDRRYGLDYQHLEYVMGKLAKYHAATAVIGEKQNPNIVFDIYMNSTINEEAPFITTMLKNILRACADVCKNWDGYEIVHGKLLDVDNISKKCISAFSRDDNEFNVLCHGDLWSNNIMFKDNNQGKLEDAILVDFQIGYWGSPALDLCNFLYMSSAYDITEKDWDNLIQYYHGILKTTLLKLNYTKRIPSSNEILIQVLKRGIYAAVLSTLGLGIRKLEDEKNMNLDLVMADTDDNHKNRVSLLSRDDIKVQLQHYLDFCNRKGYLD